MAAFSWSTVKISAISPTAIISLASSIGTVQQTLQAIKLASQTSLNEVKTLVVPYESFLSAAGPIKDELVKLMDDLYEAGVAFAPIRPASGSFDYLKVHTQGLLRTEWDADYPGLEDDDYGFLIGFYASAKMDSLPKTYRNLTNVFSTAPDLNVKMFQAPQVSYSPKLILNWQRERANRAGAEVTSPWTSIKLIDLVPNGRQLFNDMRDTVEGILASDPVSSDPMQQMISYQTAQTEKIVAEITALQDQISVITALFTNDTISILKIEPGVGGVKRLQEQVAAAFDQNAKDFPGVEKKALFGGAGVIMVGGGNPAITSLAYTALTSLFAL